MKALDTNILVCFLVSDDEAQTARVQKLFEKAEKSNACFFVSTLVVIELIWVLGSVYNCSRSEILNALESLSLMPILVFERLDLNHMLIEYGRSSNCELSDLLIGLVAEESGCSETLTFDKKASRSGWFELM